MEQEVVTVEWQMLAHPEMQTVAAVEVEAMGGGGGQIVQVMKN